MNRQTLSEWLLGLVIVLGLILLINPFGLLMPSAMTLMAITVLTVAILSFAAFVWREQPRDEREALYRERAGHVSFFVGGAVLVAGVIVQTTHHRLDTWLAAALGVMVITKLAVSALARRK